jgi:hypothetical protein
MAIKRKAVCKTTTDLFKGSRVKAALKHAEEESPQDAEIEEVEEAEGHTEEVSEEQRDEETKAARTKELKAMGAADLKELLHGMELPTGKKEEMINTLLEHEAKVRAEQRELQARIRAVVVQKKEELEAKPLSELKELCAANHIGGMMSKTVRVEKLLQQWHQEDGVDKALAQMAQDKLEAELAALDNSALQKLCKTSGVDPLVKEVMVDRLVKFEVQAGRFLRPVSHQSKEHKSDNAKKKGDLVDTLLANEAKRKKDLELAKQQEEAANTKRSQLRSMSVDELKKLLSKKGIEPAGKKEDMVEAVFEVGVQDDKLAARKAELKAMSKDDLTVLLASMGLKAGPKEAMISSVLDHEAQLREKLNAYEIKIEKASAKKKEDLEGKTAAELKDLCIEKGVKPGVGKEDRVERLLEVAKKEGEIEKILASLACAERRGELAAMEKLDLLKLCEQAGVDPLVKAVMVERLLTYEAELGHLKAQASEPATKKARATK